MTLSSLSILLRLSELLPTAQRLRELIAGFAEWGYDAVYIDWNQGFPWRVDERFRSPDAYREELVSGLFQEAREQGIALNSFFPGPDELEFVARIPSYAHLFRRQGGHPVLDLSTASARKFFDELIEDFLSLIPDPGTVVIDYHPDVASRTELELSARDLRNRGVTVIVRLCGSVGKLDRELDGYRPTFEGVVIPVGSDATFRRSEGGVIHEFSVLSDRGRSLAETAVLRVRSAGSDESEREPILLSFQPDDSCEALCDKAGPVGASIEVSLPVIRFLGECGNGIDVPETSAAVASVDRASDMDSRCGLLAADLERILDEGWLYVRRVREGLSRWSFAGNSFAKDRKERRVRADLAHLADRRHEARRIAKELQREMSRWVEGDRVAHALAAVVLPLTEEYYALMPRTLYFDGIEERD